MESIIEIKDLSFRYQADQEHYDVHNISFQRETWRIGCLSLVIMVVENQQLFA